MNSKKSKEKVSMLFTDERKCTGCRSCELACSFYHYKEHNPSRALLRIIKIEDQLRDIPLICRHCGRAPCIEVCPVGAISRNERTGAVVIDQSKCIKCRACVEACPFSIIVVDPISGNITKCDLCDGNPRCAQACVTGAIFFRRWDVGPRVLMRSRVERREMKKP